MNESASAPLKRKKTLSSSVAPVKELNDDSSFCSQFCKLMANIPFIMIVLSNSFIFFILTGIQYWVTDYLITDLGAEMNTVHLTFGIVSITGPVLGVVIGGNVTSALGGFKAKRSLMLSIVIAIMCVVSAVPIPFITDFWAYIIFLWFLLFFGGFNMPCFSGMMLETVDNKFKATGNAVANLSYNLIGFLPAPSIYGFVYDYGDGGNGTAAMATLMFTPIISLTCVLFAACLIIKNDTFGYRKKEA